MVGDPPAEDDLPPEPGRADADVATAVVRRPGSFPRPGSGHDADAPPEPSSASGTPPPVVRRTARASHELEAARERETRRDGLRASTPAETLRPGTQLAGRYRILELL